MYSGTGTTPLIARQAKGVYTWLVFPIIIIIIAVGIWLLFLYIKKIHSTPEWIEAQKKRITNKKDVNMLAAKLSLSRNETALLWDMCCEHRMLNIFYSYHDAASVDSLFKARYLKLIAQKGKDTDLMNLFRLRYKIECAEANTSVITSTSGIPEGSQIIFIDNNGMQIPCRVKKNTAEEITMNIPRELYASETHPSPLEKAKFLYVSRTGMHYLFATRIVRYSIGVDGKEEMCIINTTDLHTQVKRQSKRATMMIPCDFSAVNDELTSKGVMYKPSETKHQCTLQNISAEGCCIITRLPIKEHQNICVYLPLSGRLYPSYGMIVKTRKNSIDSSFYLHISFLQIEPHVQSLIYAMIYGYDKSTPAT
jgi:hypothetical protein